MLPLGLHKAVLLGNPLDGIPSSELLPHSMSAKDVLLVLFKLIMEDLIYLFLLAPFLPFTPTIDILAFHYLRNGIGNWARVLGLW